MSIIIKTKPSTKPIIGTTIKDLAGKKPSLDSGPKGLKPLKNVTGIPKPQQPDIKLKNKFDDPKPLSPQMMQANH